MNAINTKWKLVKSQPVFESKWLSVFENDYNLPNGKEVKNYYHLARPNYVLIIAIDKDNNIIVERNYRRGVDDFVYELPAGWLEEKETPDETARRELEEETGYIAEVKTLGEIYPQPSFSSMIAYVALAKINSSLRKEQKLDHDEHIKYELISLRLVKQMIAEGTIKDMGFLSALQLASL